VGEEIEVEDQWEELDDGQTEPMRSQVREETSEGDSVGGKDTDFGRGGCHWQGGFEQHYKIGTGRVESRENEKLGQMESQITCHCNDRNC
jgi:hypothetical protein